MSASITLDASQIRALDGFMDALAGADTSALMEIIGVVGENAVSENFEGEHDPDGLPWLPSQRAQSEGGKTLTDHGILAGSIESQANRDSVEIGTNMVYAAIHNFGGTIKRKPSASNASGSSFDMPKRQFLGWGRDALDDVERKTTDWLAEILPAGAA